MTDACERGSYANEVASNVTQMAFDDLDAPPVVVGARNWITPAHELEEAFFPQPSWILDAIDAKIVPLKGWSAPPTRPWCTSWIAKPRAYNLPHIPTNQ